MKKTLFIVIIAVLFTNCEKEDDDSDMNRTTPSYISSDCEGF